MLNPSHRKYCLWLMVFEVLLVCFEVWWKLVFSQMSEESSVSSVFALLPVLSVKIHTSLTERSCVAGITLGEEGVLTIERVKKDDEGLYECTAKNSEGVAKTSAVVTVLGKSFRLLVVLNTWPSKKSTTQPVPFTIVVHQCEVVCATVSLGTNQIKYTYHHCISNQKVSETLLALCFLITTANSSGLTSAWKVSPDRKSVAARNAKWIPSWVLWSRLWLRVLTLRTWPLWSVKRSTNECKEIDCCNSQGTGNTV